MSLRVGSTADCDALARNGSLLAASCALHLAHGLGKWQVRLSARRSRLPAARAEVGRLRNDEGFG
jgi:hypothetical protein